MSRHSKPFLAIDTATKTAGGIVLDGFVFKSAGDHLSVKLLVPSDGSTPQLLHHSERTGDLSSHEILEFCDYAVNHAYHWLGRYKLLEKHDLTSVGDWHYDGPFWRQECAFRSPSLDVLAIFDGTSGKFLSFVGCMVRQGRAYRHPSKRLGTSLFAKIVMATAMRTGAPTPNASAAS